MKTTKTRQRFRHPWLVLAALAASVCCAGAQSADALIDKLVDKGILTVKEANDLREEADKNFTQAYAVKSGMPDWVTALKFNGDLRGRFESFSSGASGTNGVQFVGRNRFRYRVRFGATVSMFDNLEAGFRLTSSEASGSFGGDPISGNTSMQDNGSKKFIFVDQAYGRWYMLNGPDWLGVLTIGKMENPLVFDDMVFDGDYTPEGAGINFTYVISGKHSLKMNAAGFVLDEIGGDSSDPYLLAAQARWDAVWNTKWASTFGLAGLSIESAQMLANAAVPAVNRGNSRVGGTGVLQYHFNPVVVDGAVTFTAPSFPLYRGPFPIRVGGAYMNNPAAPSSADNYAWNAGVIFGKSGKKKTWDLSYSYKWLGANSWYEELVDSDFGAFYGTANSPANSGSGIGYGSGTNVRGHIMRFAYSPADSLTLSVKWFMTELINAFPDSSDSEMNRVQVDAAWKF